MPSYPSLRNNAGRVDELKASNITLSRMVFAGGETKHLTSPHLSLSLQPPPKTWGDWRILASISSSMESDQTYIFFSNMINHLDIDFYIVKLCNSEGEK